MGEAMLMKRRRKSIALALCLCGILVAIVSLQSTVPEPYAVKRRIRKVDNTTPHPTQNNCIVHVHGLHHGGTGFAREVVYNSLGGNATASKHVNTGVPEDEGQHLQSVYPLLETRRSNPTEYCGVDLNTTDDYETTAMCYTCPKLVMELSSNSTNKLKLHSEWSRHWDTSKPFLIQKTPTLDILLLERMKVHPTVHVIVMRHPFAWMESFHPNVWLRVWTYTLELLSRNKIQSFVVVNYETLVLHRAQVERELASFIRQECAKQQRHDDSSSTFHQVDGRRRLEWHEQVANATKYLSSSKMILRYNHCLENDECKAIMDETAPALGELGYDWNSELLFRPPGDDTFLLYTSDRSPTNELVEQMKHLHL